MRVDWLAIFRSRLGVPSTIQNVKWGASVWCGSDVAVPSIIIYINKEYWFVICWVVNIIIFPCNILISTKFYRNSYIFFSVVCAKINAHPYNSSVDVRRVNYC